MKPTNADMAFNQYDVVREEAWQNTPVPQRHGLNLALGEETLHDNLNHINNNNNNNNDNKNNNNNNNNNY